MSFEVAAWNELSPCDIAVVQFQNVHTLIYFIQIKTSKRTTNKILTGIVAEKIKQG